ncbi:hypothetical protein Salat_1084400 [Sesamum alatum]|uniref:F-box protein At3g26010-like beta-propeller domain-containing protein n=1 Tax=Sesamum alatum TaxID=300844 RepID=A0AAE1YNF9_9LAMI|nr:hypothetical protein Salat_1084400 [Sesamum alatum]
MKELFFKISRDYWRRRPPIGQNWTGGISRQTLIDSTVFIFAGDGYDDDRRQQRFVDRDLPLAASKIPGQIQTESSLLLCLAETSDYFYLQCNLHPEKWVPYHFCPTLIEPTIRSFSNGLFLLQSRIHENPLEDCYLYNPTTKLSRRIPLRQDNKYRCILGLNLAFDPLKSLHYKIICIWATTRRSSSLWRSRWRRCQIEVYESETSTWELCGEPFLAPPYVHFDHGIYWEGGIHWRGIFFDLHVRAIREHPGVMLPGDTGRENFVDHYVESNGYLHYITHFREEKSIMVFELQSDYSQWSLRYHIDLERASGPLSVLSMIRGDSEEDITLVVHEPGKIMAYNLQDKSVKELINFTEEAFHQENRIQFASQSTFQFIETLAPA